MHAQRSAVQQIEIPANFNIFLAQTGQVIIELLKGLNDDIVFNQVLLSFALDERAGIDGQSPLPGHGAENRRASLKAAKLSPGTAAGLQGPKCAAGEKHGERFDPYAGLLAAGARLWCGRRTRDRYGQSRQKQRASELFPAPARIFQRLLLRLKTGFFLGKIAIAHDRECLAAFQIDC